MSAINEIVSAWFPVVGTIAGIVFTAAMVMLNNRIDARVGAAIVETKSHTDTQIRELAARVDEHHGRLTKLEAEWDGSPRKEDLHALALQVAEVIGELKAIRAQTGASAEKIDATQRSVQRINDYLLNEKAT